MSLIHLHRFGTGKIPIGKPMGIFPISVSEVSIGIPVGNSDSFGK